VGEYGGGFQFNGFRKFVRTEHFSHELSLMGGYGTLGGGEYLYVGPSYGAHFYGGFVEAGLVVGEGDYANPSLMFQLGYIHEFR
jgi:hypothetical protein